LQDENTELARWLEGIQSLSLFSGEKKARFRDALQAWMDYSSSWFIREDIASVRAFFKKHSRKLGATWVNEDRLQAVRAEVKSGLSIQFQGRATPIEVGSILISEAMDHFLDRLQSPGKKKWAKPPTPSGWLFTVLAEIAHEAVPESSSSLMVWKERGAPALWIEKGPQEAKSQIYYLRTELPWTRDSLSPSVQKRVASRMLKKWQELFPFIEFHWVRFYPDWRESASELQEEYGYPALRFIPAEFRMYSKKGMGTRSGMENVFVVSPESYPEMGLRGPWVAALESVAAIAQKRGFLGPLGPV
jgi:hypothetical protein